MFLELALRRQNWESARDFFGGIPAIELAVTTFTLRSLGIFLTRRTPHVFDGIVADVGDRGITVIGFEPSELHFVTKTISALGLDFDDAFIYTAAEKNGIQVVSFDRDFDRTPRGRRTPAQVLAELPK